MASDTSPQMGTEPESVDAQKGTMKDVFVRCLKKNLAQVCMLLKTRAYHKEKFFSTYYQPLLQVSLENHYLGSPWLHR